MDVGLLLMLVVLATTAVNCSQLIQPPASASDVARQPVSSDNTPADDGRY